MEDGQLLFDFAWAMRWAIDAGGESPGSADPAVKFFLGNSGGAFPFDGLRAGGVVRPVGLPRVISVDRAGQITEHWQARHLCDARKLARFVAGKLPAEAVRIRRTVELVRTIDLDEEIPPARAG